MGLLETVTEAFAASKQRAPGKAGDDGSAGAYWCDDCGVRIRDVDVDVGAEDKVGAENENTSVETNAEGTPKCPDCGETMRFERAGGSSCAC